MVSSGASREDQIGRLSIHGLSVFAAAVWLVPAPAVIAAADARDELKAAIAKIDVKLYEQSLADVRAWLDARIRESGDFGVYSFGWSSVRIRGNTAQVDLNRGAHADAAAQFFRAYEMLGDRKYLEAGLKTADFYMQVQQAAGNFPCGAAIQRGGKAKAAGGKHPPHVARLEDGYQFRPFCLLLYAWRLTGERKYLDSAKRYGELVTSRIQHPVWGWCPDHYDTKNKTGYDKRRTRHGTSGVAGGGSYSDYATTDGFRASVIMYHATKNTRYLARSAHVGKWLFATQLGKGKARGWADNYDSRNQPVVARNFEGKTIDPRNFNRFAGPLLTWIYAMTGRERYRKLFEETYTWMRSVEKPRGWAAEYTYDGRAAWTQNYKTYEYDKPETWPKPIMHVGTDGKRPLYGRSKVQLDDSGIVHGVLAEGGREAFGKWYRGSIRYNEQQYLAARLAAARRSIDADLAVTLQSLENKGVEGSIKGKYLQRVRIRPAAPDCPKLPKVDSIGRGGLTRQSWHGPHTWTEPYRPPLGWAAWQYVWDVRLALGKIDADTAASGGRGMENQHSWESWDMMGDWTTRCIKVQDWMNVPLKQDAGAPADRRHQAGGDQP